VIAGDLEAARAAERACEAELERLAQALNATFAGQD
jgi:hypothetical protein